MKSDDLLRFETAIAQAPAAELPAIAGELERLRAAVWVRLLSASSPAAAAPTEDRLLTMPEAAKRLGITEFRARELGRCGDLATVRVGDRGVRVRESAVDEYIARNERGVSSATRRA